MKISNVIPLHKCNRYPLFTGKVSNTGEIDLTDLVGEAYLKNTSSSFFIKLWLWPDLNLRLARCQGEYSKYLLLNSSDPCQKVGSGRVNGSFIQIQIPLIPEPIFLSLFPEAEINQISKEVHL